jgi:ferredoxin
VKVSLRVDPIACDAHGLCAELLPEMVRLDDWGYPIIDPGAVPAHLLRHARRAVFACPRLALSLARPPSGRDPKRAGPTSRKP